LNDISKLEVPRVAAKGVATKPAATVDAEDFVGEEVGALVGLALGELCFEFR